MRQSDPWILRIGTIIDAVKHDRIVIKSLGAIVMLVGVLVLAVPAFLNAVSNVTLCIGLTLVILGFVGHIVLSAVSNVTMYIGLILMTLIFTVSVIIGKIKESLTSCLSSRSRQ